MCALLVHARPMTARHLIFESHPKEFNHFAERGKGGGRKGEKVSEWRERHETTGLSCHSNPGNRIYEVRLWCIPAICPLLLTIHRIRPNRAAMI